MVAMQHSIPWQDVVDKTTQGYTTVAGPKRVLNSLTAIDGQDRQYFNELRSTVGSRRIFIRSQSLIAR